MKVLPRENDRARAWWFARSWIPVFAVAAVVLAPAATSFRSTYALRWLAVGLVLLASVGRSDRRVANAALALSAAGALYVAGDAAFRVAGGSNPARLVYSVGGVLVAATSIVVLTRRRRAFDPVLVVAVQLAIGLVAYWLYYVLGGLALDYRSYQPESALRSAGTELGLLGLAFAAVGVGVQRTWRDAAGRLGWRRPEPWQLGLAVVLALILGLSNVPLNLLMGWLMPDSQAAIAQISRHVFTGVPAWSLPLIALMAGIGEETAFRGALQPRFGIFATAVLFALIHVQYGATIVTAWVFVHALIYGLVRRHINTTTAVVTHATYDLSAFLNGSGFVIYGLVGVTLAVYLLREAARRGVISARGVRLG